MWPDPHWALAIGAVLLLVAGLSFRPNKGWFSRLRRNLRVSGRTMIEDALKHLYHCEYTQLPCTLHSLSGALSLSGNRTARLLRRLAELDLVSLGDQGYRLTVQGRSYALRVVRIHRLWERYLAEVTGLSEAEWHSVADQREHSTSPSDVDAMAARMADPRYDPHGDPIPRADGEMPPVRGVPLTSLSVGSVAEIVHIEDEPEEVYAQLVAEGIHLGMQVRLFEVTGQRCRLESAGEELVLAPVVAANLTVVPLENAAPTVEVLGIRLSALHSGEQARVLALSPQCRGVARRRLLDLGMVPGTVVRAELRSSGGDPTAYRLRGSLIALRREQADCVRVERVTADGLAPSAAA